MKKILFVHYALVCGGVETALLNLCALMDKKKYEITVLEYIGDWNEYELKPEFLQAGIRVITPYYKLRPGKNVFHKIYNIIQQERITRRRKRRKVVLNEKFDAIVYYQVTDMHIKCLSPTPIISYIHGDIETNLDYRRAVQDLKEKIAESSKIVCVSNLAKISLAKIAGISENVVALFNPINSEKICLRSTEAVAEQFVRPYICAVGRLAPEKRFDELVRIHRNLLDRGLNHDLVIVGEGPERQKIESTIKETGTENSVHLLGFRENPYPYMKNSLFTVCSSNTEGLPVISMESLLLGKPIVSSFPTVRELFGDEQCGLITELDVKSLEEGIYKMLSDRAFYEKCVAGAKARSSFFDSRQMVQHVEEMFDEVLSENKR